MEPLLCGDGGVRLHPGRGLKAGLDPALRVGHSGARPYQSLKHSMTDPQIPQKHPLADAARTLFKELTEAGRPVVGTGIGEGQIFLRVAGPDHGAPAEYRGYPVVVLTDEGIKR